jgi:steroid delta-isomerase-like uncharacterized protein
MSTTSNRAAFKRFLGAMNTGDPEVISETIDELVESDAQIRTPLPIEATGAQLLKEVFGRLHRAFPDLRVTVEDVIAEEDKVVSRNSVTGTHLGEYMGIPPTGKSVTYNEIFIGRFVNGRIAETWGIVDVLSQMRQLGVIHT